MSACDVYLTCHASLQINAAKRMRAAAMEKAEVRALLRCLCFRQSCLRLS